MIEDIRNKRIDYLIITAIACLTFIVIYPFSIREFDVHHTGLMFQMAHDVANGKKMFSEVFNQYGVLPVLIQACFIKFFGDKVKSIILSAVISYVITYCLNYLCFYRLIGRFGAFFTTMVLLLLAPFYFIYWTFLPWSSVYALMFLMCTMLFFEDYLINKRKKSWYISAISAFGVFLSRQPVGIVVILSFVVIAVSFYIIHFHQIKKSDWIKWWLILLSLFLAYLGMIYIFCGKTGLKDYYLQMFVWPMLWSDSAGGINTLIVHLFPLKDNSISWTVVPVGCLLLFFILLSKLYFNPKALKDINSVVMLGFSVFAVASWAQYYPITCIRHLFWSVFPMMGVFIWGLIEFFSKVIKQYGEKTHMDNSRYIKFVTLSVLMAMILLWGGEIFLRFKGGILKLINGNYTYEDCSGYEFLDGIMISDDERVYYADLHKTIKELESSTGKPILNLTRDAYYSTFSDTDDEPLFLFGGMAAVIYENYHSDLQDYINDQHPIILTRTTETEEYPMENYQLYTTINSMRIYVYND